MVSPGGREWSHPGAENVLTLGAENVLTLGAENYLTIMKGSKLFLGFLPIDISTAGDFPSRDNGRGQEVHQDLNLPSREGFGG